jgi:hypothetical protein
MFFFGVSQTNTEANTRFLKLVLVGHTKSLQNYLDTFFAQQSLFAKQAS